MADGELAVGGRVAGAEARAAEALAEQNARGDQVEGTAGLDQRGQDGHGAGVYTQGEDAVADGLALQDVGSRADGVVGAAGAAGDLALVDPDRAVVELLGEVHLDALELLVGILFHNVEDVSRVLLQLVDRVGVGGMHRHRDRALDGGQVDVDAAVVPGHVGGLEFLVVLRTAVDGQVFPGLVVGDPDGGPAGGLGGHDVDRVAVFHGQAGDAGADELHDLVLDVAVLVDRADDAQSNVVGADAGLGRAGQIDRDDARALEIVGSSNELLGQLAAAFADAQGADGAVAGVGVGAEDHLAAAGHQLSVEGVDVAEVGGDIDAAELMRGGEGELVVVFVDRAADRAQGVVAVGEQIRKRELRHAGSAAGLNDADVGDVVRRHRVVLQAQIVHAVDRVVGLQNAIGHRTLEGFFPGDILAGEGLDVIRGVDNCLPVYQINSVVIELDHVVAISFIILSSACCRRLTGSGAAPGMHSVLYCSIQYRYPECKRKIRFPRFWPKYGRISPGSPPRRAEAGASAFLDLTVRGSHYIINNQSKY